MVRAEWTTDIHSQIYKDSIQIRQEVFIEEQGFPPDSDIDDLEAASEHLVLYEDHTPLATARIYNVRDKVYRIERVAVLKNERSRGLGKVLLQELENHIEQKNAHEITLKSKGIAVDFYKKHGYEKNGEEFLDYGIPHLEMVKKL